MKKRLRKKLHLGEYQEFGFEVSCSFVSDLSDEQFDNFIDTFIQEAIESNRLSFGGGGDKQEWKGFVTLDRRGSATEKHKTGVSKWLESNPEVIDFKVGGLIDSWYGEIT
jgi:uncharacterized protein YggL (DUF469 family)